MGGLDDAAFLSVAWAMFAAVAGTGLTIVAIAFFRRTGFIDALEFDGGYNALATVVDR